MALPALRLLAFVALLSTLSLHTEDDMRCDGKLVGLGRSRIEVLKYCGEPQDKIAYLDEKILHRRMAEVMVGTTRETRQTGSYVETSRTSVSSNPKERPNDAERGGTQQLPTHTHDESRVVNTSTTVTQSSYAIMSMFWECKKTTVYVDEYTYNLGTGKFMTFIRFENGRLQSIRYGEYGFQE